MSEEVYVDHYEALQVSPTADPETIHRIYRLLAQRFHPDNKETGSEGRFRIIHEAYRILSHPERRAKYDIVYQRERRQRWRLVAEAVNSENDFELEQIARLTLLEVLYTRRRLNGVNDPGIYSMDLEELLGRPREHIEFTIWYLVQKRFILRDDASRLVITADGIEFLERNYQVNSQRRRLQASTAEV
jgi:curved DNA-binding protein CbpA